MTEAGHTDEHYGHMTDHRGQGPTAGTLWWEQQEWEGDNDYLKFMAYRDMGASRRLHKAAAAYYDRTDVGPKKWQVQHFKDMSMYHNWTARIEAMDMDVAQARAELAAERREQMFEDHWRAAKMVMNGVLLKANEWQRDPASMPNGVVPGALTSSANLMRLTMGEATTRSEDATPQHQMPDYSQLTDKELDQLAAIGEKLYGLPTAEEQGRSAEGSKKRPKRRPPHERG